MKSIIPNVEAVPTNILVTPVSSTFIDTGEIPDESSPS
jgi:hypothetical protein